ncbi:hypothetical protein [Galbibacter sp. BG1]
MNYQLVKRIPSEVGMHLINKGFKKLPDAGITNSQTFINNKNKTFWGIDSYQSNQITQIISQRENEQIHIVEIKKLSYER